MPQRSHPSPTLGPIVLGSTVTYRNLATEEVRTFTLLAPDDGIPGLSSVSPASPVGRALVGRRPGDQIAVEAPRGTLLLEILAVR